MGRVVGNLYPGIWQDISQKRVAVLIGIVVALIVIIVLLVLGTTSLAWTGFGKKKVWDWLDLLIVPLFIALSVALLGGLQACAQQRSEEQRAHQAAVQAYLDEMGQLMLAHDRSLLQSKEGREVQTLARARTLTVLGSLESDLGAGPNHKRTVMEFLYEASLIDKDNPVIRLDEANLEGADLKHSALVDARLAVADLRDANLSHTELDSTYLRDADLRGANLANANFSGAFLQGAKEVTHKMLDKQTDDLELATMTDGTVVHDGRYVTDEFVEFDVELNGELGLPMSFNVGQGWKRPYLVPAAPGELYLESSEGGLLIFTSPLHVFDTSPLSHTRKVSAPDKAEKWVSWFQNHPKLDTLKPVSRSVGNKSGEQIDVTSEIRALMYLSKPENQPLDLCGKYDCVPLAPFPKSTVYGGLVSFAERTGEAEDRFVIVDVGGKPVVIYIGAPAGKVHEFFPKARKLLETVEWENSGAS